MQNCWQILSSRELSCLWKGIAHRNGRDITATPVATASCTNKGGNSGKQSSARGRGKGKEVTGGRSAPQPSSNGSNGGSSTQCHHLSAAAPEARLARYGMARSDAILHLLQQLATIPECFEMARATGLTLNQVLVRGID